MFCMILYVLVFSWGGGVSIYVGVFCVSVLDIPMLGFTWGGEGWQLRVGTLSV